MFVADARQGHPDLNARGIGVNEFGIDAARYHENDEDVALVKIAYELEARERRFPAGD